ncbi:hypothetical protein [Streptomyces sp. NBC_00576]|uniref:hypothetical protein n=1 Tax=Streptomyces sp. NBC_00576 TaxID=2903665 RepID=UPI002E8134D8|nr:hypothetical protein [Streptomyces sp. NBC_00576]WUB72881.1 hypothetical protein OG734_23775 [Streptomyces sp. NBC_00576]
MSTAAPRALGHARQRAWLRAFVLLLALSVPGTHACAHAVPLSMTSAESGSAVAEYDVLDTVLRPVTRGIGRPAVPLRPAPFSIPTTDPTAPPTRSVPPRTPRSLQALRSVVLRC